MIFALLLATAPLTELRWEADAVVHAGGREIAIQSRTVLLVDGSVESNSWPVAEGEAAGLRQMIIDAEGNGWLRRNGESSPMPEAMLREEGAQYGFYLQLQEAARWCDGQGRTGTAVRIFPGAVETSFRCTKGQVTRAANWVASDGAPVRQDFRLLRLLKSRGAVFPRAMVLLRDGQPYFDMKVRAFSAR